jgi:hypothetical protein
MVLGDGDALQAMIKVMCNQLTNGDFILLRAPEVGRFWESDYFRIVMDILSPANGPGPVNPALMHQCCDECRFGLKCPLTARYMRNRIRFAGNYELTRSVTLLNCKGHGNRDHQAIKGYIDPTTSRSDYVREGHSKLASALVQDLLGGLWVLKPGEVTKEGQSTKSAARAARANRPRPVSTGKRTQRDPEGTSSSSGDKIRKAKAVLQTVLARLEEDSDEPPPLTSDSEDGDELPDQLRPRAPPGLESEDEEDEEEDLEISKTFQAAIFEPVLKAVKKEAPKPKAKAPPPVKAVPSKAKGSGGPPPAPAVKAKAPSVEPELAELELSGSDVAAMRRRVWAAIRMARSMLKTRPVLSSGRIVP